MDMSFVLRITSSIGTDFENIWFPHQHLHIKKKKNRRTSPSLSKTSRFLENEPAKKKTTLASPFLPQGKRNFLPKTPLGKFCKKNKKPSSLKTFISNNHATGLKFWRKRNFPRRRKKRQIKIGRKKEKRWDCISIDTSAKHRRSDDNVRYGKKEKVIGTRTTRII